MIIFNKKYFEALINRYIFLRIRTKGNYAKNDYILEGKMEAITKYVQRKFDKKGKTKLVETEEGEILKRCMKNR